MIYGEYKQRGAKLNSLGFTNCMLKPVITKRKYIMQVVISFLVVQMLLVLIYIDVFKSFDICSIIKLT